MLCSVSAFLLLIETFLTYGTGGERHLKIQYTITVNKGASEASG